MVPVSDKRRPAWLYQTGDEPDPRFSMANERTFLAWVRTALAVLAGSVALHVVEVPAAAGLRSVMVVALALVSGLLCVAALVRWARVERSMRRREPLPPFGQGLVLALMVALLAVALAYALAVSG